MAGQRTTTYILLRKNKESGPFSLEELKAQEILPNDLFWMEGQSACWLNPGEIKELKDLVGQTPGPAAGIASDHSAYLPPENGAGQASETTSKADLLKPETAISNGYKKLVPPVNTFIQEEPDPEEPETRYAKPLEEIKALYLKNLERQQRRRQFTITIPPALKKASPYLAFLAIGLLAGILINQKGNKHQPENKITREASATKPVAEPPANIAEDQTTLTVLPAANSNSVTKPAPEPVYNEAPPPDASRSVSKKAEKKDPVESAPVSDNNSSVAADERAARSREADLPEETGREDISSLVSVSTNDDYLVGSFGGIRNLQLTVKNNSGQPIELVTAELRYYKPGDELLKTEHYQFYNVPARGMQVIAVPKSARGVKVSCKLVRIETK